MSLQEAFNQKLSQLLKDEQTIAVATSGGSDSLALTILTNNYCNQHNIKLIALTVDHKLRKRAKLEAETTKKWLSKYGVNHEILTHTGQIPTSNVEAVAREYRYKLLTDYLKQHEIKTMLVGHNLDEQVETFFLNLSRGSGILGLSGIKDTTEIHDIKILRPLLEFSKSNIQTYLKSLKQKWVEDPSNKDTKYKRVRIRNLKKLLEKLELSPDRIMLTIKNLQRVRETIEINTNDFIKNIIIKNTPNEIYLNLDLFKKTPEEICIRGFAEILKNFTKTTYPPRLESLNLIYNKIKEENFKPATLCHTKISIQNDLILIEKEHTNEKKITGKK